MLAEAKASFIHWVARSVLEKASPQVRLYKVDGAKLETAKDWEGRHDFHQAAIHYFSTYQNPGLDSETRGEAFFDFIQQLINLGAFRQARETLNTEFDQLTKLELLPQEKVLLRARRQEKLGWLADYELGYLQSRGHFSQALRSLHQVPREDWGDIGMQLNSTAKHFMGRAELSLARMGINRENNIKKAVSHFREALNLDEQIPDPNKEGKLGLGHAWITRCYILAGDMIEAKGEALRAAYHLRRQKQLNPHSWGSLAHEHLLYGELGLRDQEWQQARDQFLAAVEIRTKYEKYPKGLADAYSGLASTYSWRNPILFTKYMFKAWQVHPYTVLGSSFGG